MTVDVQVVDAEHCLDQDLLREELAVRRIHPSVRVRVTMKRDGDARRLDIEAFRGADRFPIPSIPVGPGDCDATVAATASAVESSLREICPACFVGEPAWELRQLAIPVVASVGAGAWDVRLGAGVASLLRSPLPGAMVIALGGEASAPVPLGDEDAHARIAEAFARVGWASEGADDEGLFLAGGLGGGAATAWGADLPIDRAELAPAAHAWLEGGLTPFRKARVAVGVRANFVQLNLYGREDVVGTPAFAEPWVRAEVTVAPVIFRSL
jgi:hypothetical protein